jgi:hypothetical protein
MADICKTNAWKLRTQESGVAEYAGRETRDRSDVVAGQMSSPEIHTEVAKVRKRVTKEILKLSRPIDFHVHPIS